ncbi:ROK family protein [Arthrobacter dokdonensis]|uniref:ROK family protein n=1 Tax=Arthrobacter dokdonellae TaxID=2211210 RepID=UPI001494870B|nr:ROK family protein [Arthrobacter dokdonellae]
MTEHDSHEPMIALDVGGTAMKGAVLQSDGRVREYRRWATPRADGPEAVVNAVMTAIDDLITQAPDARSVGLVVPGLVDDQAGVAIYSENIGWRDVPFREMLMNRTGISVGFGHDVRAGGLAERVLGAAQGANDVLFMPIGTGISGAMYVEGRSIDNKFAGEIGHIDAGTGEICACGATGCLETIATGPSIARRYNALTDSSVTGAKPVVERMLAGDGTATRVWEEAVEAIAHVLVQYVTLLSPELIVIGGGLSAAGDHLLEPLSASLHRRLVWQEQPRIVPAALGDNAACLGAGILARQALSDPAVRLGL